MSSEFNKTAPAPPASAAPAPAAGENGACPADKLPRLRQPEVRVPKLAPGAAGNLAPCEGAVQRPATSEPGRRSG